VPQLRLKKIPGPEDGWVPTLSEAWPNPSHEPQPLASHAIAKIVVYVAFMSRGAADRFRKSPEMLGNKREHAATRCDMKIATPKVAELHVSL
jgi:hypothetical protein